MSAEFMDIQPIPTIEIETVKESKLSSIDFNDLPFGKTFSDHMFICEYYDGKWQTAKIQPYQNISLSPACNVFHYGQAIFEGMKAYYKEDESGVVIFRPEMNLARFLAAYGLVGHIHHRRAVRRPVTHVPVMRDDACTGFERKNARAQGQVHFGQQVHGDDGGGREVSLEQILLTKLCLVGNPCITRIGLALFNQPRVDLDPQARRLKTFGRQNDDAPVT